ncbi:MAG: hypothetical protein AAB336_07185 [Acidobacteriota bacterium]
MKKEVISVFDGDTTRKATLAEKIGASIFWIITIPILLIFFLMLIVWAFFAFTGITS